MSSSQSFVANGHELAKATIHEAVIEEYGLCLEAATFFERLRRLREIEQEVERRAEQEAPRWALY